MATAEQTVSAVLEQTNRRYVIETGNIPENMGGRYQYPKAVLDAVGKRYLVEHTEGTNDNGTWWADRYSDGWVEQGGTLTYKSSSPIQNVVFPYEFNSAAYSVTIGVEANSVGFGTASLAACENKEQSNMDIHIGSHAVGCFWEAKGFAA